MKCHTTIRGRSQTDLPPCQSITLGKVHFQMYTQVHSWNEREKMAGPTQTYRGHVADYSERDIAEFREKVQHFIVRWGWRDRKGVPEAYSAQVYDTRMREFFSKPGDEPLEDYLSIEPLTSTVPVPALVGATTPEAAAARQDAEESERRARETDPTDASRRKRHGRAKRDGEGVDA